MSRTFQAISNRGRTETHGPKPVTTDEPLIAPRILQTVEETTADTLPADEVPFIEVGGPRPKKVEAVKPVALKPAMVKVVDPTAPPSLPIMQIAFQPMPELKAFAGSRMAADLVTFHQPAHPVSGQYRQLHQAMAAQLPKADRAVMVLANVADDAGASTAALNLAISRAIDHRGRVLLIDAKPGTPTIASRVGCVDQPGLSELLTQLAPLGIALQPTELHNLTVLAWGQAGRDLDEQAWSRLPVVMTRLMQRFEWILVDAPRGDDLKRWVAMTDGVYLVVRKEEWDSPNVDSAHEAIRAMGGQLRGCLMTAA